MTRKNKLVSAAFAPAARALLYAGTATALMSFCAQSSLAQTEIQPAGNQLAVDQATNMAGSGSQGLQEIVVTAQKRRQSAQDVPLSLSTISGAFIAKAGLPNVQSLATYTPNLTITTSPGISQINIRGIGAFAGTRSFEQSVGVYVDEIYSPRSVSVGLPLMDVARVEVLRGPQGVLFGKNSIAGAISITTAKPEKHFGGAVSARYEFEYGSPQLEGHVSIPLTDHLFTRFAAIYQNTKGYVTPVVTGGAKQPRTEVSGVRGTVLWEPTGNTDVTLKVEHYDLNADGTNMQLVYLDPDTPRSGLANYIIAQDRAGGEDFKRDNRQYSDYLNTIRQKNDNVTFRINQKIGNFNLTYLFGYQHHDRVQRNAFDFSAIDMIIQQLDENYKQTSHELRLSSPADGFLEYTIGAYYIDRHLSFPGSRVRVKLPPIPVPPPSGAPTDISFTFARPYFEHSYSWSAFAQATMHFTPTLGLTVGGRYNSETKNGRMTGLLSEPVDNLDETSAPITSPLVLIGIANSPLAFQNFSVSGHRVEHNFDPSVNLQWKPAPHVHLYVTWSKATKSGGFNNNDAAGTNFQYEPEKVHAIEAGIKSRFLDNRAQLNVSVFRNDYTDLQVSYYDGNGFQTGNAAAALVKGVESDILFEVTSGLRVGGDLAYLDAKYKDYVGACSTNPDVWVGDCLANNGAHQDLAGRQVDDAPKWSAHLFADNQFDLTDSLSLTTRVDASYKSSYPLETDQDPNNIADSIWLVDLRVAIENVAQGWSLAVVGHNLLNKQITAFGGSAPLLPGVYFGDITPPRRIDLSLRYQF